MRSVEIRNGRLFYYGSAVGYLEGDGLTADPMFRREALERWLERKNLPVRWVDGSSSQIPPSKCASLGWIGWPGSSMAPTRANTALLMMDRPKAKNWKTSGTSSAAEHCPEEIILSLSQM